MDKMYILHHNDLDGRCAASIVIDNIEKTNKSEYNDEIDCHCIELSYDKNEIKEFYNGLDKCIKNTIYILDYSFSDNDLKYLIKMIDDGYRVIWNDHHPNSQDEYVRNVMSQYVSHPDYYMNKIEGVRTLEYCGAVCTYKNIHGLSSEIPYYLKCVNEWDMFRPGKFKFIFNYGISTYLTSPYSDIWKKISENNGFITNNILPRGKGIYKYLLSNTDRLLKNSTHTIVSCDGKEFLAIVVNDPTTTFILNKAYYDNDAVIMWYYDAHNGIYRYSVRSNPESKFDCNKFALSYGGGGHVHAAGFSLKELKFQKLEFQGGSNELQNR